LTLAGQWIYGPAMANETGAVAAVAGDDDLLLPDEVARILRVPVATLNAWRSRKRVDGSQPGPKFIRTEGNRVLYKRSHINEYLAEREGAARASRA
jgi:hypothetical protein